MVESRPRPQLGLALSGGGFRAAFFHLGVLARMAEAGLLRQVEVISTVSGGSIIGALYYLHVKDLVEHPPPGGVADEHYVQIVEHMQRTFFDGVKKHVRAQAYADLGKNFEMRKAEYSRSDRIGELYDEYFYRPAWNEPLFGPKPREPRTAMTMIQMRELSPAARAPRLLVNATSLNTGHNWRFAAEGMGEDSRSGPAWVEIDKNKRLRDAGYAEITAKQQDFELGKAVAASACVPALFHPLAVSELYEGVRVQLVDGGVHDNQGVCGLIDTDCQRMVVSDASGQMGDFDDPTTRIPAVGRRSASIQGDRVREEQMVGVLRRPVAFMHLRKGLPARVHWPLGKDKEPLAQPEDRGTIDYGVHPEVQRRLAAVRTDLDSFTEVEAWSLARYGYLMADRELAADGIAELWAPEPQAGRWEFNESERLRAEMEMPGPVYLHHLDVAGKRFFKALALGSARRAKLVGRIAGAILLALVGAAIYFGLDGLLAEIPVWTALAVTLAVGLLLVLYLKPTLPIRELSIRADRIFTWLFPALLAPVFWVAAKAMLWLNPRFLDRGRIAEVWERSRGGTSEG